MRRFFATKECTKSAPIVATQSEVHSWTGGSTIVSVDDDPRAPLDPLQEDRSCEACGNDIDEILVTCKKCRVRVHPSCVGVNPDKLPGEGRKVSDAEAHVIERVFEFEQEGVNRGLSFFCRSLLCVSQGCPIPPFTCLPCSRGVAPTCELCGLKGGPLKPTERGGWGHIPCAWQVPEVSESRGRRLFAQLRHHRIFLIAHCCCMPLLSAAVVVPQRRARGHHRRF